MVHGSQVVPITAPLAAAGDCLAAHTGGRQRFSHRGAAITSLSPRGVRPAVAVAVRARGVPVR